MIALIVAPLVMVLAPLAAGQAEELKVFSGTWEVVSGEEAGREIDGSMLGGQRLIFGEDGKYRVEAREEEVESGTYTLDPSKSPRALDLKIGRGNGAGKTQLGIYRLEGEMLTVVFHRPGTTTRPEGFESKAGEESFVLRMKRKAGGR